ncbi:MAG: 2-amino-4-hydroxy-6-hydroxymethyldihydropteridine diphosphokinase [Bacteroidales bacterium]
MAKNAFLGIGTNLGDRDANIKTAVEIIRKSAGELVSCSDIYETEPWGFQSENNFLNLAVCIATTLGPTDLLHRVVTIESQLGRERITSQYTSRTMDIDILLYGEKIINRSALIIPHPLIPDRRFVLVPLCDIAPEFVHPVLQKTLRELLDECSDERKVRRYARMVDLYFLNRKSKS